MSGLENRLNVLVLNSKPPQSLIAYLRRNRFNAVFTHDVKNVLIHLPDFILISSKICEGLRRILRINPVPVIYLGTPPPELRDEIDDYISLPLDYDYLSFKLKSLSRRIKMERDMNPLTGLPGNRLINIYLNEAYCLNNRTVAYIDINDFKPYNDTYGFGKGDEIIRFVGKILSEAVTLRTGDLFLGHIGGDDFIIIGPDNEIELLCRDVISKFENNRNRFYSARDLSRGSIIALDREGKRRSFPLLSLSIVSFSISQSNFRNVDEVTQRAMYIKKWIKAQSPPQGHSIYFKDEEESMVTMKKLEKLAASIKIPLYLRRSLIEAMGEVGDNSSFYILKGLLDVSQPIKIRKSAIYALGRLKDPRAVAPLIDLLSDPNPHLRTRAVEALGEIGRNEAYEPILKLVSDKNNFVRQKAIESLGRLGNTDSYPFLVKALTDADKKVSKNAISAIGEIKNPAAIPFLIKFLKNPDPHYRSLAIAALGKILHSEAAQAICDSLNDRSPYVQWQALYRIPPFIEKGFLEQRREFILDRLLSAADSKNDYIRRAGIIALGSLKDRRGMRVLTKALTEKNDLIRWSAVLSLGHIADKGAIPYLLKMLRDRDDFVRAGATWALGEIGDKVTIEPLRQSLKDTSLRVRESAAASIIKIILRICSHFRSS